jgi:hypothetical protein
MKTAERLGLAAGALAVFSLVEPRVSFLGPWCALACLVVFVSLAREGIRYHLLPSLIGLFAGIIAHVGYNLGADTLSYLANLASLLQDFDLDQSNQLVAWGLDASEAGPAGMSINAHPVGNAFVWAGPALIAHGYAILAGIYATNFVSPPYLGAVIATNLAIALSGALALARLLARQVGLGAATLAVSASVLASPVVFYLTEQPLMSHGLAFGFASWAIVAVARASRSDEISDWLWAGAAIGAATACRFQAAVLFALVPLLGAWDAKALLRRAFWVSPSALLMLLPQIVVFLKTFGQPFAIPLGSGFMDWASPHWADTLFSADRGLFNWHPMLVLGLFGLLLPRRSLGRLALSGAVVFTLTVWINGAVRDFNASDAFGARRYDIVFPFFAIGFARLLAAITPILARRPLALPALFLALAAAWNLSFMADYGKVFIASAPLADVASAQVHRLRRGAEASLGWLGPRMRFRIYDAFVGLYTYRNYQPGGNFDVATMESRFMGKGWSAIQGWDDGSVFRYLLYPQACILIPFETPFDLRGFVLARSPARIKDQRVTLILNGRTLTVAHLPPEWTEVPFVAPRDRWRAGENEFCIRADKKRPGDEGDDPAYAAAVIRVQLP